MNPRLEMIQRSLRPHRSRRRLVPFLLATLVVACRAAPVARTTAEGVYYEARGAGPAVVLVHAFSVDRRMWDAEVDALAERHRVIRFDLRGHGRSVAPAGPYTGHGDLCAVLDELGVERATLVGLSAGAALALDCALAHPERVAGLVLASPGLGGYEVPRLAWFGPVFEAAGAGEPERAARLWAETPIMELRSNVAARDALTALILDNTPLWTYTRTEVPLSPPAIGRLSEVACPTLVLVGEQDLPHVRDVARLLDEGIRGATLVTIPGAGHILNLDAPGPFDAAVAEFLERR